MCEMRTCKTCGETKPLEEGFYKTGSAYSHKVHYRHICKHCVSETINKKGKERRKEAENEAIGMRTCKTCGETKPLETGFPKCYGKPNRHEERKTYYENSCLECRAKKKRECDAAYRARKRGEAEIDEAAFPALAAAIKAQEEARAVINLFESIKAAHDACPILGFSLWTGDTPQRLGAW